MTLIDWNDTARGIAGYMQQFRSLVERGALRLQCEMANAPSDGDLPVVVSVFGNDNHLAGRREVQLLRNRLDDSDLEELGYGESDDGSSWAMLIGSAQNPCQTKIGKMFHVEMMQMFLDDLVWRAWETIQREK
jgi:hypothetical protein